MRKLAVFLALTLGACSVGQLTPQAQQALTVACNIDKGAPAVVQGAGAVVSVIDPATVGAVILANQADQLAHPAIQAACAAALPGSTPAVVVVSTVAPVAAK